MINKRSEDIIKNMMIDDLNGVVCFISELYTVTRERIEQELETVLSMVDEGQSPILITDDGKPDLLLFSWEDYKRRFSHLCSTDELERLEEEIRQYREESNDLRDV